MLKLTYNQLEKLFEHTSEILFLVENSKTFDHCWIGRNYKDSYWLGLTRDGNGAYDYDSFEKMANAPVFEGKSLKELLDRIAILEIDACDPVEMYEAYVKESISDKI